jgi:hypothetical protein
MICPQCQGENEEGANFCAFCGAELAVEEVYCSQCGAANEEGSRFCGECGAVLAPEPSQPVYAAPERPVVAPRKTSWAWWLLPLFFAWVGGLIAWVVVREGDRSKARGLLILGLVMTAFWFLFGIVVGIIVPLLVTVATQTTQYGVY